MARNKPDAALVVALQGLSDDEVARLPGSLRAMLAGEATIAWNEAKRARDAAIAAATETVREEVTDEEGSAYVRFSGRITDPDAVASAMQRWQARKAELLVAGGEG